MKWDYRIGTRELQNETSLREFKVVECYYNNNGKPKHYVEAKPMSGRDSYNELKNVHELISIAFSKPVIDLDNFPEEYKK